MAISRVVNLDNRKDHYVFDRKFLLKPLDVILKDYKLSATNSNGDGANILADSIYVNSPHVVEMLNHPSMTTGIINHEGRLKEYPESALSTAIAFGSCYVVLYLIEKGANLELQSVKRSLQSNQTKEAAQFVSKLIEYKAASDSFSPAKAKLASDIAAFYEKHAPDLKTTINKWKTLAQSHPFIGEEETYWELQSKLQQEAEKNPTPVDEKTSANVKLANYRIWDARLTLLRLRNNVRDEINLQAEELIQAVTALGNLYDNATPELNPLILKKIETIANLEATADNANAIYHAMGCLLSIFTLERNIAARSVLDNAIKLSHRFPIPESNLAKLAKLFDSQTTDRFNLPSYEAVLADLPIHDDVIFRFLSDFREKVNIRILDLALKEAEKRKDADRISYLKQRLQPHLQLHHALIVTAKENPQLAAGQLIELGKKYESPFLYFTSANLDIRHNPDLYDRIYQSLTQGIHSVKQAPPDESFITNLCSHDVIQYFKSKQKMHDWQALTKKAIYACHNTSFAFKKIRDLFEQDQSTFSWILLECYDLNDIIFTTDTALADFARMNTDNLDRAFFARTYVRFLLMRGRAEDLEKAANEFNHPLAHYHLAKQKITREASVDESITHFQSAIQQADTNLDIVNFAQELIKLRLLMPSHKAKIDTALMEAFKRKLPSRELNSLARQMIELENESKHHAPIIDTAISACVTAIPAKEASYDDRAFLQLAQEYYQKHAPEHDNAKAITTLQVNVRKFFLYIETTRKMQGGEKQWREILAAHDVDATCNGEDWTLLMAALDTQNYGFAHYYINNYAKASDINAVKNNVSALKIAIQDNHLPSVLMLVDKNADIDSPVLDDACNKLSEAALYIKSLRRYRQLQPQSTQSQQANGVEDKQALEAQSQEHIAALVLSLAKQGGPEFDKWQSLLTKFELKLDSSWKAIILKAADTLITKEASIHLAIEWYLTCLPWLTEDEKANVIEKLKVVANKQPNEEKNDAINATKQIHANHTLMAFYYHGKPNLLHKEAMKFFFEAHALAKKLPPYLQSLHEKAFKSARSAAFAFLELKDHEYENRDLVAGKLFQKAQQDKSLASDMVWLEFCLAFPAADLQGMQKDANRLLLIYDRMRLKLTPEDRQSAVVPIFTKYPSAVGKLMGTFFLANTKEEPIDDDVFICIKKDLRKCQKDILDFQKTADLISYVLFYQNNKNLALSKAKKNNAAAIIALANHHYRDETSDRRCLTYLILFLGYNVHNQSFHYHENLREEAFNYLKKEKSADSSQLALWCRNICKLIADQNAQVREPIRFLVALLDKMRNTKIDQINSDFKMTIDKIEAALITAIGIINSRISIEWYFMFVRKNNLDPKDQQYIDSLSTVDLIRLFENEQSLAPGRKFLVKPTAPVLAETQPTYEEFKSTAPPDYEAAQSMVVSRPAASVNDVAPAAAAPLFYGQASPPIGTFFAMPTIAIDTPPVPVTPTVLSAPVSFVGDAHDETSVVQLSLLTERFRRLTSSDDSDLSKKSPSKERNTSDGRGKYVALS